jgi:hypothetical protein
MSKPASKPSASRPSAKALDTERRLLYSLAEALPCVLPDAAHRVLSQANEGGGIADADKLHQPKTRVELSAARKWRAAGSGPQPSLELPIELTVVVIAQRQLMGQMATEEVRNELSTSMTVSEAGVLFAEELFVPCHALDADAVEEVLLRALGIYAGLSDEEEEAREEFDDEAESDDDEAAARAEPAD